jgi:ribosomal protein S18 acetylase RimI-like enzyme
MKAGTILREFEASDGRKVVLRTPTWEDLDDMLDFINSLVEEEAMILMETKQTRKQEVDWLACALSNMEKDRQVRVVAEVDGRMVGQCEIALGAGRKSHLGTLGISVKQGYRDVGIGQELMREAERHGGRLGVEKVLLEVFATNERAIHVYEKMGYSVVGCVPGAVKHKGEYVDALYMVKEVCSS